MGQQDLPVLLQAVSPPLFPAQTMAQVKAQYLLESALSFKKKTFCTGFISLLRGIGCPLEPEIPAQVWFTSKAFSCVFNQGENWLQREVRVCKAMALQCLWAAPEPGQQHQSYCKTSSDALMVPPPGFSSTGWLKSPLLLAQK